MIVDANLLLYAAAENCPQHAAARDFLTTHLNGVTRVGIPWQSISAFLRIMTNPRLSVGALDGATASGFVEDWLAAPAAWMPEVTPTTWRILRQLIHTHRLTGNLIPDAQLAALAIQYGVPVASADTDFARFGEIRWINPVAPA